MVRTAIDRTAHRIQSSFGFGKHPSRDYNVTRDRKFDRAHVAEYRGLIRNGDSPWVLCTVLLFLLHWRWLPEAGCFLRKLAAALTATRFLAEIIPMRAQSEWAMTSI